MPPGGYFGRALVVDLGDGGATTLALDDAVLRTTLGGVGLGTHLLSELAPPGVDAARARGAARVRVLAARRHAADDEREVRGGREVAADRAPQRRAGVESLRDRRQADRQRRDRRPRRVRGAVGADRRRRRRADRRRPAICGACPRRRPRRACAPGSDPAYRIAAIGPAGERLVRYATVSHDGRHAGRGGLGAVLGAKRLKAVAVRATRPLSGRRRRTRCSPPRRICARARSGPRRRSTATSARSPTCSRSTRSPRCRAATSAPRRRRSRSRTAPPCATAARRARSAASGS